MMHIMPWLSEDGMIAEYVVHVIFPENIQGS
jgi:hypothetical protein